MNRRTPFENIAVETFHRRAGRTIALAVLLLFGTGAVASTAVAAGPPDAWTVHALGPSEDGSYLYTVGYMGDQPPARENGRFHGADVVSVNVEAGFLTVETDQPSWFESRARLDSSVRYIAEDADDVITTSFTPDDPKFSQQWGFGPTPGVDAVGAWDTSMGSSDIVVAVLDSGVQADHPDLGTILQGWDPYNRDATPEDDCGHGTHVAGTVGALTDNSRGVAGTAQVIMLPVKVLGDNGGSCTGSLSALAHGITYAADQGAHVITMSVGCNGCYSQAVEDAMAYAASKDIVIVAAAGNEYGDRVLFPANSPRAIAVTAVDRYGDSPSFVSVGPEVELAAPGVSILSTVPGSTYAYKSGTSMATPHVAGVAALVRSVSGMSADSVRSHLQATAADLGLSVQRQGWGAVDAASALEALDAPAPAPDPNEAPTASFGADCVELTCMLDASGSTDPDGDSLSYAWDLGDGTSASGVSLEHTYADEGAYTITLTVTDPDGASDVVSSTVEVDAPAPADPAMHVQTIYQYTRGVHPHVIVWIYDAQSQPVEDAAVTVAMCKTGGDCRTFTGYTDERGALGFSWQGAGHGEYSTCVVRLDKAGWVWDKSENAAPDGSGQCLISTI